jgi:hypothetical protein
MKKKSGIFVDHVPNRLVKNSFLSVYRDFQINERKKSGNSSKRNGEEAVTYPQVFPIEYGRGERGKGAIGFG